VLPHDLLRTRTELAPRMADLIYNGLWFSPLRRALQAFVDTALQPATGEVTVELFRGHARVVARTSPMSLYQPSLASFDMTGYNAQDSAGFIRLFGLPLATAARRAKSAADLAAAGEALLETLDDSVTNGSNGNGGGSGAPTAAPQVQGIKHAW
jgi:argininosuccinate synthase